MYMQMLYQLSNRGSSAGWAESHREYRKETEKNLGSESQSLHPDKAIYSVTQNR